MFYETTTKVTRINERGEEKQVIERYVIQNCETFREAEERTAKTYAYDNVDGEVISIRRSNIYEIVNEFNTNDKYFKAKLASYFVDEKGKEKVTFYHVLVNADNMDNANKKMKEYINQGLSDMSLVEIKETNLVGLI